MGVSSNAGSPSHHACFNTTMGIRDDWMIWGYPHDIGNLQMAMETLSHDFVCYLVDIIKLLYNLQSTSGNRN